MSELQLPWLLLSTLLPLGGALVTWRCQNPERARYSSAVFALLTFAVTIAAWSDFAWLDTKLAIDPGLSWLPTSGWLALDELSAPLLPLASVLYLLICLATLRTKIRRFSFSWSMFSLAVVMATLSCREPWVIIAMLALGTVPPLLELRSRGQSTRVYTLHMGLFIVLLVLGWALVEWEGRQATHSLAAVSLLMLAILIRSGVAPLHCWVTDLFEKATFGTALLFVTPMLGAYAVVRLLLPVAPSPLLQSMGMLSLGTAVYTAGLALVQGDPRRFFCNVFLSHSALVLVGLETLDPLGVTGALCVWLSVGLSLAGFGLALRALEARQGRLSLFSFHGHYENAPLLAIFFLLTGLASVGFPGTFGFLGTELLVDGVVQTYPLVGIGIVIATALNGIAIVRAYFRLFTGTRREATLDQYSPWRERIAIVVFTLLILGGGVFPQPGVASRHHAAKEILAERQKSDPELRQYEAARSGWLLGHIVRGRQLMHGPYITKPSTKAGKPTTMGILASETGIPADL